MSVKREEGAWSPYVAGALAGLLVIGSAFGTTKLMGKTAYLNTAAPLVRASAMVEREFLPERVENNAASREEKVAADWQLMLVCGIFVGALLGAVTSGSFEWEVVPPMWAHQFGRSVLKRGVWAFAGGTVAMFGVRLADGCPIGYGLSGVTQLSVSGIAAMVCFFVGGAMVADFVYGKGGRHE